MRKVMSNRRRCLGQLGAGASLLTLTGCDAFDGFLGTGHPLSEFLRKANVLTKVAQRAIQGPAPMAREYPASAIREDQRPNGSTDPQTADYLAVKKNDFAGYRLQVTGLVDKELSLSLDELRTMPSRTSQMRVGAETEISSRPSCECTTRACSAPRPRSTCAKRSTRCCA